MNARALAAAFVFVLAAPVLAPAKPDPNRVDAKSVWLPYDYTPVTDEDKALADVPFAPGTPAVILLEAQQEEWTSVGDKRIHYHRRVKVLKQDGVEEVGNYTYILYGDWRLKEAKARTILKDGTVVDAGDGVHRAKSEGERDVQEVRIAFPRVEPGAILDVYLDMVSDSLFINPWQISNDLPTMESRFVLLPPTDLRFRSAIMRAPQELSQPKTFPMRGATAYCWQIRNVAALPDVPNAPADEDMAQQLVIILDSINVGGSIVALADSWKTWLGYMTGEWEKWLKGKSPQAQALAQQACNGKTTPRDKAEAIRVALAQKVHSEYDWYFPGRKNADEVLAEGSGSSADVAGLALVMLRSAGVTAQPAAIRRRGTGTIPADLPIPGLFEHAILRVEDGGPGFWFDPTAETLAGLPAWDSSGIVAAVFKKGADAPVPIPDFNADQNAATRAVDATLAADGSLEATVTVDYIGIAADERREEWRGKTAEAREAAIRKTALAHLPGATMKLTEVKGLEAGADMLTVRYAITAPAYGQVAGKRLLVNPLVGWRFTTDDWSAEKRDVPVDLGGAYQVEDTIRLRFPEGIAKVELPGAQRYNADGVGYYDVAFEPSEDHKSITVRRKFRLDRFFFAPEQYPPLRQWVTDMAGMDDRSIVLTFP